MDLRGWDVRGVAVGAVVALVLAGCNGDPEVEVTPTPTPVETVAESPSPTPSPSPTALTEEEVLAAVPDDLQGGGFLGAVHFAQFFIELYPRMFAKEPETALFEALSETDCDFCADAIATSQSTRDVRAHTEGGLFSWSDDIVTDARGGEREDGYWYVAQPFTVTELATYLEDGTLHSSEPAGHGYVGLKLSEDGGTWKVHGVEFQYEDE